MHPVDTKTAPGVTQKGLGDPAALALLTSQVQQLLSGFKLGSTLLDPGRGQPTSHSALRWSVTSSD